MIEPELKVIKETYLSREPGQSSAWVAILSMGVLLFSSLACWQNRSSLASQLAANPERVFAHGEYWRLLTAIAVHADWRHLASNGLAFGLLSYLLYGYFGVAAYPILSLALGSLVNGLALLSYPPETSLVGASGVVYLMAAFWLTSYVLIERRLSLAKRLLRSIGFGMILLLPSSFDPLVSYRTHALGLVVGALVGASHFFLKKESFRKHEVVEID